MSKILVNNIADTEAKLVEAIRVIIRLRKYKKKWDEEYGATNRSNLRRAEEAADQFLQTIPIKEE